jgi:hypothetical protein
MMPRLSGKAMYEDTFSRGSALICVPLTLGCQTAGFAGFLDGVRETEP